MIPTISRKLPLRHILPSAVLAFVMTALVCWNPFGKPHPATFHALIKSNAPGFAGFDTNVDGFGIGMREISVARVDGNGQSTHLKFDFAGGRLSSLLLIPLNKPETVEIQRCWITSSNDDTIAEISPAEGKTEAGETREAGSNGAVRLRSRAGIPFEPMKFDFDPPLVISAEAPPGSKEVILVFAASLLGFILISFGFESRRQRLFELAGATKSWIGNHPRASIIIGAVFSVAICLFPVIFAGKSFVSPDNGVFLLYGRMPTVPGGDAGSIENPVGSDFGATMLWHLPVTATEHRAIFKDGEFPLWNRYGWGGFTLIGESISMIGDPLTWPAILTGGAAWAWDLKFIVARLLFACGIGWLVYRTSRSLPAALLLTLSAPFMGFFTYRFCHVANISLCYSPWILIPWCEGARAKSIRTAALWSGLLIFANWCELNSGTAKESSALIFFLNAAGGFMVLFAQESWRWRALRLAVFGWASVVFLLLSTPLWLTFFDALGKAWTIYDAPKIYQMQPGLLIGLFDDIFQRQLVPFEYVFNPSANFFVFLGVIWAAARIRALGRDPFFLASLVTGVALAALAFGVVSPALAVKYPLLRNIIHFDNTFSCALLVLLFVYAGYGIRECLARVSSPEWKGDWIVAMAVAGVLAAAFFGLTQAAHRVGHAFLKEGETLPKSAFFEVYVPALMAAIALLPWALREISLRRAAAFTWVMAAVCLFAVIHFRHGMYLETKFDLYAANPKKRMDLRTMDSPALRVLRQDLAEPGRLLGLGFVMTPGFNAMLGLESSSTPDALMNARMIMMANALGVPRVDGWRLGILPGQFGRFHRALDFFNVSHILDMPGGLELPGAERLCDLDFVVTKSPTAWPRAFFTNQVTAFQDVKDLARMVYERDGRPFAALTPEDRAHIPLPAESDARIVEKAGNYHLTNNTTSFEIDAPTPGLAVLMEANIPGDIWATVDGMETPCITVDYAFRGVVIPKAGHHTVKFGYWPAVLEPALWCGGAGLVCLLLSFWLLTPRKGVAAQAGMLSATANARDPMAIQR